MPATPRSGAPGTGRDAIGHAVEPTGDRLPITVRTGLLQQDQKSRLEGVVRLVRVSEDRPANAEDHRTMALNNRRERAFGGFACPICESFEQLAVGQASDRAGSEQDIGLTINRRRLMMDCRVVPTVGRSGHLRASCHGRGHCGRTRRTRGRAGGSLGGFLDEGGARNATATRTLRAC